MNRTPVDSSYATSVGYDVGTMTLEIEHTNGSVYQYFDVPETIFSELLRATSLGQFMHANIRNNYRYAKI